MSELSFSIKNILFGATKKDYLHSHFCPLLLNCPWAPGSRIQLCPTSSCSRKVKKGEEECVFQVPSWSAWEAFPEAGEDVLHLKWHTLYCRDIFPSKTRSWWQPSCVCQGSRCFLIFIPQQIMMLILLQPGSNLVSKPQNKREEAGGWGRTKWKDWTARETMMRNCLLLSWAAGV